MVLRKLKQDDGSVIYVKIPKPAIFGVIYTYVKVKMQSQSAIS